MPSRTCLTGCSGKQGKKDSHKASVLYQDKRVINWKEPWRLGTTHMFLTSEREHEQASHICPHGKQQQSKQKMPKVRFCCPYCEGEEHFLVLSSSSSHGKSLGRGSQLKAASGGVGRNTPRRTAPSTSHATLARRYTSLC